MSPISVHADAGLHPDLQKALGLPEVESEPAAVDGILRVIFENDFRDTLELRTAGWTIRPGRDRTTLELQFGGQEDSVVWRAADAVFRAMIGVPKQEVPTHVGTSWTQRSPTGRIVCEEEHDFGGPRRTFCTIHALRSVRPG